MVLKAMHQMLLGVFVATFSANANTMQSMYSNHIKRGKIQRQINDPSCGRICHKVL